MKKWISKDLLFLLLPLVLILNIDFVVIPALTRKEGSSGFDVFALASILATFELIYWYWFWGRIGRFFVERKTIQEDLEFSKTIGRELKKQGFVDKVVNYFTLKYEKLINKKSRISKFIKGGGCTSMFLAGAWPEPGGRTLGVISCNIFKSRSGFYALAVGNIVKVAYVVWGWNFIFGLF